MDTKTQIKKAYRLLKLEEGRGDLMELTLDMTDFISLRYVSFETEEEAVEYLIDRKDDIGFSGEYIVVPTYVKVWDYDNG